MITIHRRIALSLLFSKSVADIDKSLSETGQKTNVDVNQVSSTVFNTALQNLPEEFKDLDPNPFLRYRSVFFDDTDENGFLIEDLENFFILRYQSDKYSIEFIVTQEYLDIEVVSPEKEIRFSYSLLNKEERDNLFEDVSNTQELMNFLELVGLYHDWSNYDGSHLVVYIAYAIEDYINDKNRIYTPSTLPEAQQRELIMAKFPKTKVETVPKKYEKASKILNEIVPGTHLTPAQGDDANIKNLVNGNILFKRFVITNEDVYVYKMQANQCHANACKLLNLKKAKEAFTGFALGDDGRWRSHSWGIDDKGRIMETTEINLVYIGVTRR